MEIIKRKSGIRYREKIYINNKSVTKVFRRKIDAEKWKRTKHVEKEQVQTYGLPILKDITLNEFSKIWFVNKPDLARRSIDSYRSALSCHILPSLGQMLMRSIRIGHAQQIMTELREKELSPSRIKLVIVFLNQLFNDAVRWDYLIHQPFKNLSKVKIKPLPEKYWLAHEVTTFLNANENDEHYALYVTALNTGMRMGELLGLQWDKVDFQNEQIEVSCQRSRYGISERTKNGKVVYVPMNKVLIKTLSALRQEARSMDFVFMKRNGKMISTEHFSQRTFKEAIERAQVKKICFRNLRTTFASNFCMKGGDLYVLSKILNHSSVDITAKKYAHLHPNYMKQAIDHIAFEASSPRLAHDHLRIV